MRVPECVKGADVRRVASVSPGRRKSSLLDAAATVALENMMAKKHSSRNPLVASKHGAGSRQGHLAGSAAAMGGARKKSTSANDDGVLSDEALSDEIG